MSQQEAQFHTVRFLLNKTVFDENVTNIILCYYWDIINDKKRVMLDWIDTTLMYTFDYEKPSYFLQNNYYDTWYNISKNPDAISFIEENIHIICWCGLVKNPNAIHLFNEHIFQIAYADCWENLFSNIHGIDFFFNNSNKLIEYNYDPSWDTDDYNELINGIIEENMSKICKNPNIISFINKDDPDILLEQDRLVVDWSSLSQNPNAIDLLEANKDKIDWSNLSKNPSAIELLEANKDKIDWCNIYRNPSIFQYRPMPNY